VVANAMHRSGACPFVCQLYETKVDIVYITGYLSVAVINLLENSDFFSEGTVQ